LRIHYFSPFLDLAIELVEKDKMRKDHQICIVGQYGKNEMRRKLIQAHAPRQHIPIFLFLLLLFPILWTTTSFMKVKQEGDSTKVTRFLYSKRKKKREEKKSWCHRPFPDPPPQ